MRLGLARNSDPAAVLEEADGAGEGNRTLVCSLGSCRSTIELRPQTALIYHSQTGTQSGIKMQGVGAALDPGPPNTKTPDFHPGFLIASSLTIIVLRADREFP
jgi:hypothetical protein